MRFTNSSIFIFLNRAEKIYFGYLSLFAFIISIIEILALALLVPFISLATGGVDQLQTIPHAKGILLKFNLTDPKQIIIAFGSLIVISVILKTIFNLIFVFQVSRFSNNLQFKVKMHLFRRYLHLPFENYMKRNTAGFARNILTEANHLLPLVSSSLYVISELFIVAFIMSALLFTDWKLTSLLAIAAVLGLYLFSRPYKKKLNLIGDHRSESNESLQKILNESFGNFKLFKIMNIFSFANNDFEREAIKHRDAITRFQFYTQAPKYILETLGIILIVAIVLYANINLSNDTKALGFVSIYVLAFYRLLPSINKIISNVNQYQFYENSISILKQEVNLPTETKGEASIEFLSKLCIKNGDYFYEPKKPVLSKINLEIYRNEKVGIVGESGSGKSTLISVIMGLIPLKQGHLAIDEQELQLSNIKAWQSKIGYIPQDVYLFDGTIADNICFGREFNEQKALKAIKQANLTDFINNKDGLNTRVGENGIRLSGGQKQRIGIARALYDSPELIIMDEGTSSLDANTETQIMKEIYEIGKDRTLIIIAHKQSILSHCDRIITIRDGGIF